MSDPFEPPSYSPAETAPLPMGTPPAPIPGSEPGQGRTSKLPLISLVISGVAFVVALIPGLLALGWLLLAVALILGIVTLLLKHAPRTLTYVAVALALVGILIAPLVYRFYLTKALSDAFDEWEKSESDKASMSAPSTPSDSDASSQGEASSSDQADGEKTDETGNSESPGVETSRENPAPLGSEIKTKDWTIVVNSVDLDAASKVVDANPVNTAPEDGEVYVLVNLTVTYNGDERDGDFPMYQLDYVSVEGNSFNAASKLLVAPEQLDSFQKMFKGASTTGNEVIAVKTSDIEKGVLMVKSDLFGDAVFVAIK